MLTYGLHHASGLHWHDREPMRPSPRTLASLAPTRATLVVVVVPAPPGGHHARAVPSAGAATADARARAALSAAPAGGNTALHSRITMRPSPRALAGLAPTLFVLVLVLVLVLHIAATATVGFLLFLARRVVNESTTVAGNKGWF